MSIILALDPGHKTGLALLTGPHVSFIATVNANWILEPAFLKGLHEMCSPTLVVVEAIPYVQADQLTVNLFQTIVAYFTPLVPLQIISPGSWKPTMRKVPKIPGDAAIPGHARDALGLARYAERLNGS